MREARELDEAVRLSRSLQISCVQVSCCSIIAPGTRAELNLRIYFASNEPNVAAAIVSTSLGKLTGIGPGWFRIIDYKTAAPNDCVPYTPEK